MSLKEEMVDLGSRVWDEKMVTVAEWVAAKSCGAVGEKASEVMDDTRVCVCFDLNDFQYLDSGVGVDLFVVGLSFGLTANVFTSASDRSSTAIGGDERRSGSTGS